MTNAVFFNKLFVALSRHEYSGPTGTNCDPAHARREARKPLI